MSMKRTSLKRITRSIYSHDSAESSDRQKRARVIGRHRTVCDDKIMTVSQGLHKIQCNLKHAADKTGGKSGIPCDSGHCTRNGYLA